MFTTRVPHGPALGSNPVRNLKFMARWRHFATVLGVLLLGGACASGLLPEVFGGAPADLDRTAGRGPWLRAPRTVVLVSVDGLAPWVMADTGTPTLDRLVAEGGRAEHAETVVPSYTLPSHTSMISGVPPEVHGVTWNTWEGERRLEVPTVFTACRQMGLRCGLFAGKAKFAHLAREEPGVERYERAASAEEVVERAVEYMDDRQPDFVMIHLAEVDATGHRWGWGSEEQREAIRSIDDVLDELVDEAEDELERPFTVIVTADHGGHDHTHGSADPLDVEIPWIAWGDGTRIEHVRTIDTGPTVLRLLGVRAPGSWQGVSHFPFAPAYAEGAGTDAGAVSDTGASGGGQ